MADAVTRVVPLDAAGDAPRAWDADPGAVTRTHVEVDRRAGPYLFTSKTRLRPKKGSTWFCIRSATALTWSPG